MQFTIYFAVIPTEELKGLVSRCGLDAGLIEPELWSHFISDGGPTVEDAEVDIVDAVAQRFVAQLETYYDKEISGLKCIDSESFSSYWRVHKIDDCISYEDQD